MSTLIQNAVLIKETGQYLVSLARDDHQSHTFVDGSVLTIDGGIGEGAFSHRAARSIQELGQLMEKGAYEEWCLTDNMTISEIAEKLIAPVDDKWVLLKEAPLDVLAVYASYGWTNGIAPYLAQVAQYWLDKRK